MQELGASTDHPAVLLAEPGCREPLYRFLLDRFDIPDPQSRRVRTAAVRELTDAGLVRRHDVRGPRVEVLAAALGDGDTAAAGGGSAPEPAVSYEEFAAAVERDTDAAAEGRRRVEQAFLRRFLLAGRVVAPCAFCGQSFPAGLLIAAHVKRRAELAHKQRLAFDQVAVLACTLGCDSLYEQGYVAVDPGGALTVATDVEPAVAERLAALAGRPFDVGGLMRQALLAEHRASCLRGEPTAVLTPRHAMAPGGGGR